MTLHEALAELDSCRFLKVRQTSLHAARWRRSHADGLACNVTIRRKDGESFAEMIIRGAILARAGHVPVSRVPRRVKTDRCQCGSDVPYFQLTWHAQLKQRICRKCAALWQSAAFTNDMKPTKGVQ